MNYERIYNEFILDRREKQDELCLSGEYMERHHIIPRAKNGTARRKPKVFRFKKDGKIVYGDRNELSRFFNSTPASISAVIYSIKNGKSKSYKGWILINE